MNRTIFLAAVTLVLFCLMGDDRRALAAGVANAATAPATQPVATLTVRVADLRNHKGQVIFAVFKSADGFPKDKNKALVWQIKPADADTVVFTASLPPGKYAASALHDENKNGKMDMNFLGIPEEGYGVTNNPKPDYRQARFDEAVFDLPQAGATLTISFQYF
jgi:uncharacterized protein (DUF2141 family)